MNSRDQSEVILLKKEILSLSIALGLFVSLISLGLLRLFMFVKAVYKTSYKLPSYKSIQRKGKVS